MACMARRPQLLVPNGHRIGSNQHRIKVPSNVYLDQQQASTRSLLHFQERSEYPKLSNSDMALGAADALAEWRCGYYSIDETCAGRFFQRLRQRPIFRAVGSADRSDPAQMIFRLLAVALLDLPQTVIVPGQHVVRIGFQRPLVPDLRELVVAELAVGIADQIGHVRMIVMAERL